MARIPTLLTATLALLVVVTAAPVIAAPAPTVITCHMLIGGVPSQDTQRFRWTPTGLYRGDIRISSTKLTELGGFTDKGVRVRSFAQHAWRGGKLHRTAYWQYPGKPMRVAMREIYDFRAQTIHEATDGNREVCHHNGR